MNIALISDRFHNCRFQYEFDEQYPGEAEIYSWTGGIESGIRADCYIFDLNLDERLNNHGYIDTERDSVGDRFERMEERITRWLESGKVVIGLLADKHRTVGFNVGPVNQPTNYDWLERLRVTSRADHEQYRRNIEVVSQVPGLDQYFDFVEGYRYGIRLKESAITNPEILAKQEHDNETVAVTLSEYLDPDGNHRKPPGYLVLLPQPTHLDNDFFGLVNALESTANHYLERQRVENILDETGRIDIGKIREMGEGDTVEFKENLPEDAHSFAKDIVSMTNKWGGVLAVGIRDSDQSVVGVSDVDDVKNRVAGVCASAISPPVDPEIETHVVEGKQVVAVRIPSGSGTLYTTSGKVYWRFGPTSESISGSEVHEYIL